MKIELKYQIHNPNTEKETIDAILPILVEANFGKALEVIQKVC